MRKVYALGSQYESVGSIGTAMSQLGLNSDMCVIAHAHILLKYLSDHEL